MARAGRLYVPLDCGYFDDDRVVELSDLAQLLDLRALCLVRRLLSDGRLTRRQLERIAPIGGDIGELVASGLWAEDAGTYVRSSWSTWNDSAADIATMSKGGVEGNHLRWHVKRGILNPECPLCASGEIGGESGGDLAPDRGANRREEQSRADESRADDRSAGDRLPVPVAPRASRKTRAPEHFEITDAMRTWASKQTYLAGVDLDEETEHFLDHHRGKGTLFADWSAAWMTWMRRRQQFAPQRSTAAHSRSMQAIDAALGGLS